jgi:transcriptional regulator with XRE-family HTH domain
MSSIEYSHACRMAMDICILLGQRIRELRIAKGWTQTYLSVHAGVGRNYISDVELGKKEIGLRNLQLLALSLDVKTADLLRGFD